MKRLQVGLFTALVCSLSVSLVTSWAFADGFIENRGQMDEAVSYYALGRGAAVYFTRDAVVLDLREESGGGCAVYVRFEGANPFPTIEARGELLTRYNYLLGPDPSGWQTDVPAYSEIVYRDLWPGVDLAYHEDGGRLVYEVVVAPGADGERARFSYAGADRLVDRTDGSVLIETPVGSLLDVRPMPGKCEGVLKWTGTPDGVLGEAAAGMLDNPTALVWSTFYGGSSYDHGRSVVLDDSNQPIVAGSSSSSNLPTTPGSYDPTYNGAGDVFVVRLSASGTQMQWCTFLGGDSSDTVDHLALDSSGNLVVTGQTASPNFPTTAGAYDRTLGGSWDGFVAKLSQSGDTLVWGTLLGGSDFDGGRSLALDASDNVVVTGTTQSSDFPTTSGAYDTSYNGGAEAYLAKISRSGTTLVWSTFLGGSENDVGYTLALDALGNAILAGSTESYDFPATTGAYDPSHNGDNDAFVAKISASGSTLVWSTFLGDASSEFIESLALDASDDPVATGITYSSSFPTTSGAYDTSYNGGSDAFVAKLSASGSTLVWSTFLGGSNVEQGFSLALDAWDNPVVTGVTYSSSFPTTPGGYDTSYNSGNDAFVAKLSASGSTLVWSSFLGGSGYDYVHSLVLDASGNAVVTGYTESADFPTTSGAYDTSHNGRSDAFVAKLSLGNESGVREPGGTTGTTLLGRNAPNPFPTSTGIEFALSDRADVSLGIYDVGGRLVRTLAHGPLEGGTHTVRWDGLDDNGQRPSPGVYFCRLETSSGVVRIGKLVLSR